MIGMNVGVYNVRDRHILRPGENGISIRVFFMRINEGALSKRAAAEEVSRTAGLEVVVGSEDHCFTSSSPGAFRFPQEIHRFAPRETLRAGSGRAGHAQAAFRSTRQ